MEEAISILIQWEINAALKHVIYVTMKQVML